MRKKREAFCLSAWQLILLACMLSTAAFIWSNSLKEAGASTQQSGYFRALFAKLFDVTQEPFRFLYHNLRKVAHFSEFALLGAETALFLAPYKERRLLRYLGGLGCCAAVALADEGIQYFVPGRAASFVDVGIDTAGATCGMLLLIALAAICRRLFKKK